MLNGVEITAPVPSGGEEILTDDALSFVAGLHRTFNPTREALLARRVERQKAIVAGGPLTFLAETQRIRDSDWQVGPCPPALQDRRVEITGPTDRKMLINALNSGARVFMADLEDALRRTIALTQADGKEYRLNDETATLLVRPRGWHLSERHALVDGQPI